MKIIAIRGKKGSGKTTLIELLISYFKSKGLKVGAVKHAHHIPDVDRAGKDSFRFRETGANKVFLAWQEGGTLFLTHPLSLEKILSLFSDCDLVFVEGFKDYALPYVKIVSDREKDDGAIIAIHKDEVKKRWKEVAEAVENYVEEVRESSGVKMIDVSEKPETLRKATAKAVLSMDMNAWQSLKDGKLEKGNITDIIKMGAINGVKSTSHLLPLCHPLGVDYIDVEVKYAPSIIIIEVTVKGIARTGFEMEAMCGASAGALSAYDVLKRVTSNVVIEKVELIEKTGGKSEYELSFPYKVGVITVSDRASKGEREDESGEYIKAWIKEKGGTIVFYRIIPDNEEMIKLELERAVNEREKPDAIIFTGGTGPGPKDLTALTLDRISDKKLDGIGELLRVYGMRKTLNTFLSSCGGYVYRGILVITLPGSPSGVKDSLEILSYVLSHAVKMVKGEGH